MSSGAVHTRASLMLAGGFLLGVAFTQDISDLQYVFGALVGVPLNPDLDVNHGKVHGSRFMRRWPAAIFGWNFMWYGYRKSLKHGSFMTHFPVISTLIRIGYLYLFSIALPYLVITPVLHLDFWSELSWWAWQIIKHGKVVIALMGSDLIHWTLDVLTKESR